MTHQCDLCGTALNGRTFKRRDFSNKSFCSIACVEAFESRSGLPGGRVYETRPGWSSFPVTPPARSCLAC